MADVISFKKRVINVAIEKVVSYTTILVDNEYLVYSSAFVHKDEYILVADEKNYMHLVGVSSDLSPLEFYNKCLDGSITEDDINFDSPRRDSKIVKGSVRGKISALDEISSLFYPGCLVEENFKKNIISCTIATATNKATLGFSQGKKCRPKSLMCGNALSTSAVVADLILQKNKNEKCYTNIIVGDIKILNEYLKINLVPISEELQDLVNNEIKDKQIN